MKRFTGGSVRRLRESGAFMQYAWWVGSYSIIILLSILINLAGYTNAVRVIETELAKNNTSAIEHTKNIFDNYLYELDNISYNIIQSNSMSLLNHASVTAGKRTEYALNVMRDISNSRANSRLLENAYVVLRDRDICIYADGLLELEAAHHVAFSGSYSTKEAWLSDLFDTSVSEFKFLTDQNGKTRMFLCRIYTDTKLSPYKPATTAIMVEINESHVNELLAAMKSAEGEELYIASDSAGLLFASHQTKEWPLKPSEMAGTSVKNIFEQKQVVSVAQSAVDGLQYVRMLPNSIYLENIRTVRTAFILCYLLCIILGGALVWLFSRVNVRNKRRMEERLAQQNAYMREEILRQIVERKLGAEQVNTAFLSEYNLQMPGKYFVVSVIDSVSSENTNEVEKIHRYFSLYLPSMLEEGTAVNFCTSQNMVVAVFNLQQETADVLSVCNALSRLRNRLRDDLNLDFICAVSRVTIGIEGLPEAFDEAVEAMNSRFLGQKDAIFVYDDSEFSGRYAYGVETERRLINFLMLGEREGAMQVIEEVFSYNVNVKRINLSMLRVLTSEIISTLLKVAAQIDSDESIDFKELYLFSTQLYTIKQIDQSKNEILKHIDLLCDLSTKAVRTVGDVRCRQILEYIEQNYADPDLNVSKMANIFGITISWMSKYFKKQVGIGMTDYIVQFRLQKAKELMKNQEKTNKQIAEECGFSNVEVFQRAFKRYEGISPGQYRRLAGVEDE